MGSRAVAAVASTSSTSSSPSSSSSSSLGDARLDAIATSVRTLGFRIVKLNTQATGEQTSSQDFTHHANTAVWTAFTNRGGSLDSIDAFPWGSAVERNGATVSIEEAMTREALGVLRRELLGRDSAYGDLRLRTTTRANRAMVEGYQWTSWQTALPETGASRARRAENSAASSKGAVVVTEYEHVVEQEQRLQDKTMIQLMDLLRDSLSARDFKWMVERFARGMSLYEQVEELITSDASYTGPHGVEYWQQCNTDRTRKTGRTDDPYVRYCRAAVMIDVAVHRARAKARKLLGDQWGELARQVAA